MATPETGATHQPLLPEEQEGTGRVTFCEETQLFKQQDTNANHSIQHHYGDILTSGTENISSELLA